MTVPHRAALYLHVSTARQAEHDVSIPDQRRQGEYLHSDLVTVSSAPLVYTHGANISTAQASTRFDGHVVRAGLNYWFNWGAVPVVAKDLSFAENRPRLRIDHWEARPPCGRAFGFVRPIRAV
jgi:hypothetical protein